MKFLNLILCMLITLSACGTGTQAHAAPPVVSAGASEAPNAVLAVTSYEIGDIILTDGSVIKAAELIALDENLLPMAVIAGFRTDGTAFVIGVHRSGGPLQWAPIGTPGNSIKFTETVCTDAAAGDADGNGNWEAIRSADPQGTADAATNYPAFQFVNTCAETYQLPEYYAAGWYMPSIAEICAVANGVEASEIAVLHLADDADEKAVEDA